MSEHYTDGRRWSYISQAWIFADGWNDREEIARLEAKVRELEERLDRVEQERDQLRARAYEEAAYYLEYKASGPIPPDAIDHMKDCAKALREEGGQR